MLKQANIYVNKYLSKQIFIWVNIYANYEQILQLLQALDRSSESSGVTTLRIVPGPQDHKMLLSCEARNEHLPDEPLRDEVTVNVHCELQLKWITGGNIKSVQLYYFNVIKIVADMHWIISVCAMLRRVYVSYKSM